MKAVLQYRASPGFRQRLQDAAPEWLRIVVVDEFDTETFAKEMLDTDVLFHVAKRVTREVIEHAPKLRLIQKLGTGVNTIDLEAARSLGVAVANMPGTNSQAVAEMTLALMFAVLRQIRVLDQSTREGRGWTLEPAVFDRGGEISGRTIGLLGSGEIPRRLAPALNALGARVLYTSRSRNETIAAEWREFPQLLAESDILSLHIPLTAETERMMNEKSFSQMKPGSILVNTARGGLVDETALIAALKSGHVGGAGLDVHSIEPAPDTNPLFQFQSVVVTPHIAWLTPETLDRSLNAAIENCRRLRQGETLCHQVVP